MIEGILKVLAIGLAAAFVPVLVLVGVTASDSTYVQNTAIERLIPLLPIVAIAIVLTFALRKL